MIRFLIKRFVMALFSIWIISVLAFLIIQAPEGDAIDKWIQKVHEAGEVIGTDQATAMREFMGLDRPLLYRYWRWV